jgi:hypothetical protein
MRFRNAAATFAITAMILVPSGAAHAVGDIQTVKMSVEGGAPLP